VYSGTGVVEWYWVQYYKGKMWADVVQGYRSTALHWSKSSTVATWGPRDVVQGNRVQ